MLMTPNLIPCARVTTDEIDINRENQISERHISSQGTTMLAQGIQGTEEWNQHPLLTLLFCTFPLPLNNTNQAESIMGRVLTKYKIADYLCCGL